MLIAVGIDKGYDYYQDAKWEKEILSLQRELYELNGKEEKWEPIRKFYRSKLVELGIMREFKNSCKTIQNIRYIKK